MTVVNAVTDLGVVADGGYSFDLFTMSNGGATLSCPNSFCVQGRDEGKTIVIGLGVSALPGGEFLTSTIVSVASDGKSVVLANPAPSALTAIRCLVVYGTNQASKFETFRLAQQGQTVTLTLPTSGTNVYFILDFYNPKTFAEGIADLTINGTGAAIASRHFNPAFPLQFQATGHSARLATALAGQSFVQLLNPAGFVSLFSTGANFFVSGFDQQGLWNIDFGYPINPFWFEYVTISAVDSSSGSGTYGKITLSTPLVNTYLQTWPEWDNSGTGGAPDNGGPATLYALPTGWDGKVTWNGVTFAQDSQMGASGRDVSFVGCTCVGVTGIYPTQAKTFVWDACIYDTTYSAIEIDKINYSVTAKNSTTLGLLAFQSPNNILSIQNSSLATLLGTARDTTIANSTITDFRPGPYVYGRCDRLVATSNVLGSITPTGVFYQGAGNAGLNTLFNMTNGVITVPLQSYGFNPTGWAVPGTRFSFTDDSGHLIPARVLNVTYDAANAYILTDQPGTWPVMNGSKIYVLVHPAANVSASGNSGSDVAISLNSAPSGRPFGAYVQRTHAGDVGIYPGGKKTYYVYGRIKSYLFEILTPYTGASALAWQPIHQGQHDTVLFNYAPSIDLKTGPRSILVTPSGVSGTVVGGDSALTLPVTSQLCMAPTFWNTLSRDISAESSATWPSFRVTIDTYDMGGQAIRLRA